MTLHRLIAPVALVATTLALVAASAPRRGELAEASRVRAHLDSVLVELGQRNLSALAPAQRANRAALVTTLRAYRDRGVFPHNYDFPGEAVPYFVDRKTGTLCAVAHLLESTGRRDVVDRVAQANNNVWVAELASDTALAAWLETNGLTLAEAARIQVVYIQDSRASKWNAIALPPGAQLMAAAAVTTAAWNAWDMRGQHGPLATALGTAVGLVGGVGTIASGAIVVANEGPRSRVGLGAMGLGIVSTVVAGASLQRHLEAAAGRRERARTIVTPVVGLGTQSRPATAGLALSTKF
jgi:hypothetical protein